MTRSVSRPRSPHGPAELLRKNGAMILLNKEDAAAALCVASKKGDVSQVERLLKNGADPNSADYDYRTALHIASSEGHLEVVKLLIRFNANVNAADRWGSTPI